MTRIKYAYVSSVMYTFEDMFLKKYDLKKVQARKKVPVIIFGLYKQKDYKFFKRRRSNIVVVWCGSDSMKLDKRKARIIKSKFKFKVVHIAMSKYCHDDLKRFGINSQILPVNPSKIDLSTVQRGDYIYHYGNGINNFYGDDYLDEIEKRTGFKIIRAARPKIGYEQSDKVTHYTRKELIDIYSKCFIGLRLTKHDGLPNTVIEMGLLGRRCIYNGGTPHSIPWSGIDDICENIIKEYENRHEDNSQISEDFKKFLDIGEEWLHI